MKKILLVVLLVCFMFYTYFKYDKTMSLKSKVENVIENFGENEVEKLYGWSVYNRGPYEFWKKYDEDYFCLFYSNEDTNFFVIPFSKEFSNDFGFQLEYDTNINKELVIIEFEGKVLEINYRDEDLKLKIEEGLSIEEVFRLKNPITRLRSLSELRNKLKTNVIISNMENGLIEFYLEIDEILSYSVNGKELNFLDKPYLQEEFRNGKWLNKNWHLRKTKNKLDFG